MELTLIKQKTFNLKPFGNFNLKFKTRQQHLLNIIPVSELNIFHETSMPMTPVQEKELVKLMKKSKTDILTDDSKFYTRIGESLTSVSHPKLNKYKVFLYAKSLEDSQESWETYLEQI
jgi:hypothetical protein